MTIEEAGYQPEALAAALHDQLGRQSGSVPVHAIALALDIHEIREEPLSSFEGALLTVPERTAGSILVNKSGSRRRQRFTVAHELLHFLNPRHVQTSPDGFWCTKKEIAFGSTASAKGLAQHERHEREANRFAVELLLPRHRLKRTLMAAPDLEAVLKIAGEFDVSKEAAARYYAERHEACLGIALSENGRLRYCSRGPDFPFLRVQSGMEMPKLPKVEPASNLTDLEDGNPIDWFTEPGSSEVTVQTLYQQNSHAMTLVIVERDDEDEDDDLALDRDTPRFRR